MTSWRATSRIERRARVVPAPTRFDLARRPSRQHEGSLMAKQPPGPDFSHGGEFIEWSDRTELDEHFPPWIERARENLNVDVELVRWPADPNDPVVRGWHVWWQKQRKAVVAYVGPHPGFRLTVRARTDKELGVVKGYVRFDRKRPVAVKAVV